jgi:hypothetical protein
MSSSNSSEVPNQTPEKKRRYLSAEKKFQIYLEAQEGGKLKFPHQGGQGRERFMLVNFS